MKFYNNFYTILIGIFTINFYAWGMQPEPKKTGQPSQKKSILSSKKDIEKKESTKQTFELKNQTIESLNNQIKEFTPDQLEKYNPIIDGIRKQLQRPETLKEDIALNYALEMIQKENATEIIKEIKQKNLPVNDKLNILQYLSELPNPIFYEEPSKKTSERSNETIERDKKELGTWLKKKNEIKAAIETLKDQQVILQETKIKILELDLLKDFIQLKDMREKEEQQKEIEKKENLENQLIQLENEFTELNNNNTEDLHVPEWITEKIEKLTDLKDQYSKEEKINTLLEKYKKLVDVKANCIISFILTNNNLLPTEKLTQINTAFSWTDTLLVNCRQNALTQLISQALNQLEQKDIQSYSIEDKKIAIQNIIVLSHVHGYLNDTDKTLFNTNENLRSLFANDSYNFLTNGVSNFDEEELKDALDTIKKAVYPQQNPKNEIIQKEEQNQNPINKPNQSIQTNDQQNQSAIQEQKQPINTTITSTIQPSTQTPSTNITSTATKQTADKPTIQKPTTTEQKQPEKKENKAPQENTWFFSRAINGFFSVVANAISNIANYLRSWWPF